MLLGHLQVVHGALVIRGPHRGHGGQQPLLVPHKGRVAAVVLQPEQGTGIYGGRNVEGPGVGAPRRRVSGHPGRPGQNAHAHPEHAQGRRVGLRQTGERNVLLNHADGVHHPLENLLGLFQRQEHPPRRNVPLAGRVVQVVPPERQVGGSGPFHQAHVVTDPGRRHHGLGRRPRDVGHAPGFQILDHALQDVGGIDPQGAGGAREPGVASVVWAVVDHGPVDQQLAVHVAVVGRNVGGVLHIVRNRQGTVVAFCHLLGLHPVQGEVVVIEHVLQGPLVHVARFHALHDEDGVFGRDDQGVHPVLGL